LDKVEKVLGGDAEQSGVGLILGNLNGRDRSRLNPLAAFSLRFDVDFSLETSASSASLAD
jgi:hypothetical protein